MTPINADTIEIEIGRLIQETVEACQPDDDDDITDIEQDVYAAIIKALAEHIAGEVGGVAASRIISDALPGWVKMRPRRAA